MSRRAFSTTRWPGARVGRRVGLNAVVALVALAGAAQVAADAYTDAIKGEAQRIDAPPAGPAAATPAGGPATQDPQVATFERELEQRYRGTYLFYKKLPARNQEEIFRAHRGGASIEEVRKMVMDRFQHTQ